MRPTCVVPLLLALGACATSPTASLDAFAQRSANNSFELFDRTVEPPETLVLPVAFDQQIDTAACGAHVLASVINYWKGEGAASGQTIFAATPPARADGYSMAEVVELARVNGLTASAVRLSNDEIIRELESGRPVMAPVRVPAVFVQDWTLPGANVPVLEVPALVITSRVARLSEWTNAGMINHYVLVSGYEDDTFVVMEPVLGFRTISFDRFARYRRSFNNAAIVFSGPVASPSQAVTGPSERQAG